MPANDLLKLPHKYMKVRLTIRGSPELSAMAHATFLSQTGFLLPLQDRHVPPLPPTPLQQIPSTK
jgi:hypothetical protein